MAASVLNLIALDTENQIVGVSISPKKGFNIIKLWNLQSLVFKKETDVRVLLPSLTYADIIYKPHVDQKMS